MKPTNEATTVNVIKWETDRIVAFGLVVMGIIAILGNMAYNWTYGTTGPTDIPMAIVSGLTGFLGRGILNDTVVKKQAETEKKEEVKPTVEVKKDEGKKEIPIMPKDKIKDLSRDAK